MAKIRRKGRQFRGVRAVGEQDGVRPAPVALDIVF
jgi:hypothetical protein